MKICFASVLFYLPLLASGYRRYYDLDSCETIISAFTLDKTYIMTTRRTLLVDYDGREVKAPSLIPVLLQGQTAAAGIHWSLDNYMYILFSGSAPNGYVMYEMNNERHAKQIKGGRNLLEELPKDTVVDAATSDGRNLVLFTKERFTVLDARARKVNEGRMADLGLPDGVDAAWGYPGKNGRLIVNKGDYLYMSDDLVSHMDFSRNYHQFSGPYTFNMLYPWVDIILCPREDERW